MTPRQVQRVVADAIAQEMPSMMDALAERLVSKLAPHLAPLFVIQGAAAPQITMLPDQEAALRDAVAACPPATPEAAAAAAEPRTEAQSDAEAPNPAWFRGAGNGRRLTEEGFAQLRAMADRKLPAKQIARMLGMSPQAAGRQMKILASAAKALSTPDQSGVTPKMVEPAALEARTVAVVPAAVVPAPRQPPAPFPPPSVLVMASKVAEVAARIAPPPPPPKPKAEPQVINTTPKEVRAWLIASLKAGGLSLVQAQDRVGFMTHDQALAEANQRRARAGYPPFAFLGARSAA